MSNANAVFVANYEENENQAEDGKTIKNWRHSNNFFEPNFFVADVRKKLPLWRTVIYSHFQIMTAEVKYAVSPWFLNFF